MNAQQGAEVARAISASDYLRVEKIGNATLYLGDASIVTPTIGRIDAVISDPPYEFPTSGGGIFRQNRTGMYRIAAAKLDKGFDMGVLTTAVGLGANSVAVFFHFDQAFAIARWFEISGLDKNALCVWRKLNPMPVANRHYQPELEYYWHGWRKPFGVGGLGLSHKKRVWEGRVGDSEFGHPTEKPVELMRKIVINVSDPEQIVFDPFMGTGTTGVAALELGRHFVGIEHNQRWFDVACQRIEQAQRQASLFGTAA